MRRSPCSIARFAISCSFGVERGADRESVLVEDLGAVLMLEVLADLLDEERRDARRLRRLAVRDDRRQLGRVRLRLRDIALVGHALQHDIAALRGALEIHEGALALGRLKNTRDERGFAQRELLVRLVEIEARGGFDAVCAVPQVHLVAVDREDLFLRVPLFNLDGEDDLLDLPLQGFLLRQPELFFQIARELLRQRAGALRAAPLEDVGGGRGEDAPDVDADVPIELGVLGGDDGLPEQGVDVVVADDDPALRGELADDLAVGGIDARDRARRVVVERRHLRQIAGVREQHAAENAEPGRGDKQRDDARVARDFDYVVRH